MFQFSDEHHIKSSSSSRHPGKGNDTPPETGLASGDEESIREKHHPREGLRGRFETNEDDIRRLSSLLLFDLQRHTRVLFHVEAPSSEEEECQNEELERRRILGVSGSRSGGLYKLYPIENLHRYLETLDVFPRCNGSTKIVLPDITIDLIPCKICY